MDWEAGTVATLVPKETAFGWLGAPQGVACSAGCREVAIADSGNNRVLRAHIPDRIATAPGAHANVTEGSTKRANIVRQVLLPKRN